MMAKGKRGLSAEERELWNRIRRSVTPLSANGPLEAWLDHEPNVEAALPAPIVVSPPPSKREKATKPVFPEQRPRLPFLPPYVPPVSRPANAGQALIDAKTVRDIRKGRLDIDARIDLHGMTERLAHDELLRFVRQARESGARILLVITGKGRSSEGVLRRAVPLWFQEKPFKLLVGGHRTAHAEHGGEGAMYVRLRRDKPARNDAQ